MFQVFGSFWIIFFVCADISNSVVQVSLARARSKLRYSDPRLQGCLHLLSYPQISQTMTPVQNKIRQVLGVLIQSSTVLELLKLLKSLIHHLGETWSFEALLSFLGIVVTITLVLWVCRPTSAEQGLKQQLKQLTVQPWKSGRRYKRSHGKTEGDGMVVENGG